MANVLKILATIAGAILLGTTTGKVLSNINENKRRNAAI